MRSEFSANKALFETAFQAVKVVANTFNKKPEAKLSDMQSMKEFQAKNNVFGRAQYIID